MDAPVLTALEKKLLVTAGQLIQPFRADLVARVIRHPIRGVLIALGRLARHGYVSKTTRRGYYSIGTDTLIETLVTNTTLDQKRHIFKNLCRVAVQKPAAGYPPVEPALMAWAALKARDRDADIHAVNALNLSFAKVDDIAVELLFDWCFEAWPDDIPPRIRLKQAEFEFLRGNDVNAVEIAEVVSEKARRIVDQELMADVDKLLKRIHARRDGGSELFQETTPKKEAGKWADLIRTVAIYAVICRQETGMDSAAAEMLHLYFAAESPDAVTQAENMWLNGRQALCRGDAAQARMLFLKALCQLDRHGNRALSSRIMLDIARLHGINGNPVRESRCLRIAEYLLKRGYREEINGAAILYRIEMLLETGRLDSAAAYIHRLLENSPNNSRRYAFAVCAYGGAMIATRVNRPAESVRYLREILRDPESIPAELLGRIWILLNDRIFDSNSYIRRERTRFDYFMLRREPGNWKRMPGYGTDRPIPEITGQALFLRQSQVVADRLMEGMNDIRETAFDRERSARAARSIAERIGDNPRLIRSTRLLLKFPGDRDTSCTSLHGELLNFYQDLFDARSLENYTGCLSRYLRRIAGIDSGVFVINRDGFWQWSDVWGKAPGPAEKRMIIKSLTRVMDSSVGIVPQPGSWTVKRFPNGGREDGYLAVRWSSKAESSAHPVTNEQLGSVLNAALIAWQFLRSRPTRGFPVISRKLEQDYADKITGKSHAVRSLRAAIRTIASSPTSVHISGETGSGKELIARAIHNCGPRKSQPFVAFNCASCPESLIESELFGHIRGAFTGADRPRKGVFMMADKGTLFLDEIADLSPAVQAKLLRVVQERAMRPVGSDIEIPFDVRLVSATHKDLRIEVAEGRFRSDLFFRLVVIKLHAPPLRDRPEDIELLAARFLEEISGRVGRKNLSLSQKALDWMKLHDWPGNIRELQNLIETVANFSCDGQVIDRDDLEYWTRDSFPCPDQTLADFTERAQAGYIRKILHSCGSNITRSAAALGISRQSLFQKMKSLGILNPLDRCFLSDD